MFLDVALVPVVVLLAIGKEQYLLSAVFGALFAGMVDPGGSYGHRASRRGRASRPELGCFEVALIDLGGGRSRTFQCARRARTSTRVVSHKALNRSPGAKGIAARNARR